ncbi:MAG TPA: MBL fold metallo-hydrolase [Longimicrobiales bacterium]|nr:MBL fold metallo-hydrolase [Longimicrobiales bacterium]
MTRRRAAAAAVSVLLLSACFRTWGPGVSGEVDLAPGAPDALRAVYLGTGGWIFEHGGETVLTGPLFTNPSLLRTGLLEFHADTAEIDHHMSRYGVSDAAAILVGHAHYDHLMDVPRVAALHAPRARIVGSRTVANTLGTWSGLMDRVDTVDDSAGDQRTAGRWLRYGRHVRVMALRSRHAPHFAGYTLYQGTQDTPRKTEPDLATDWLEGETFAFLIDFMASPDSVAFRIYYQDAVAPPPAGLAPEQLIAERPVDVAVFVPATFDQVDWHPEALVENLRPRWILLGHWEDFFVPVRESPRSLRLTDIGHFEGRLDRVFGGEWWRPGPWTEFRFPAQ